MTKNTTYSMTGFGRAEKTVGDLQILVELKSLNGKQFDCNLRLPPLLKAFEFDIRNIISRKLQRGSIDAVITLKMNGSQKPSAINADLFKAYYQSLQSLGNELGFDPALAVGDLLRVPDVVMAMTDTLDDENWQAVADTIASACDDVMLHRAEEGNALREDIESRIKAISENSELVAQLAPQRSQRIREGIHKKLEEWVGKDQVDSNRLEQEIIYYLEKMDINEELTRLANHCSYFFDIINDTDTAKGKKLGFLLQEIGREINTAGAKANDSAMQKIVVAMKDDLEKAKEQTFNLL